LDEKAAKAKRGTREKKDLFSSPFVVEFEHGANYEGYWCYCSAHTFLYID